MICVNPRDNPEEHHDHIPLERVGILNTRHEWSSGFRGTAQVFYMKAGKFRINPECSTKLTRDLRSRTLRPLAAKARPSSS
jgi:hypothetical protein